MPLLLLGVVRILLVKRTEYPEHVSEYGVHWNFFITMGLLLPIIELVQRAWPMAPWALVALCASIMHEGLLMYTPLGPWSISDVRDPTSWVSLNKEGVTSLPGYVCIALLGLTWDARSSLPQEIAAMFIVLSWSVPSLCGPSLFASGSWARKQVVVWPICSMCFGVRRLTSPSS